MRPLLLFLLLFIPSALAYYEANDERGDVSLDGKRINYANADLIYASIQEKNNRYIFTIKVAGKIEASIYCEFFIFNETTIKRIFYKGGYVHYFTPLRGDIILENATYEIKGNTLKIYLPKFFNITGNVTVKIDLKADDGWYFDKIPWENFHKIRRKTKGFEFLIYIVALFVAMFWYYIYKSKDIKEKTKNI